MLLKYLIFYVQSLVSATLIQENLEKLLRSKVLENQKSKDFDSSLVPPSKIRFKNLRLTTIDGTNIGAYLISPKKINSKTSYAVLLHGNSTNRWDFIINYNLCERVIECNMVVIVPDYRDFGDSEGYFDMKTVVYDVDVCFQLLKELSNNSSINIISFSFGTTIALRYMEYVNEEDSKSIMPTKSVTTKKRLKKVFKKIMDYEFKAVCEYRNKPEKIVLVGSFASLFDILKNLCEVIEIIGNMASFLLPLADKSMGIDNLQNIHHIDPEKLLIIHSEDDELTPFSSAVTLCEEINCYFYAINNCDHCETFRSDETWEKIRAFIY